LPTLRRFCQLQHETARARITDPECAQRQERQPLHVRTRLLGGHAGSRRQRPDGALDQAAEQGRARKRCLLMLQAAGGERPANELLKLACERTTKREQRALKLGLERACHQREHQRAPGDGAPGESGERGSQRGQRPGCCACRLRQSCHLLLAKRLDHGGNELGLRREIAIHGARSDAGTICNGSDLDGRDAVLRKRRAGGRQNGLAPGSKLAHHSVRLSVSHAGLLNEDRGARSQRRLAISPPAMIWLRRCSYHTENITAEDEKRKFAEKTMHKPGMNPAEWEQRINLAACYRLVDHFGWTDLIYTHISARVPGKPGHFLLNRFGLLFEEVTASNLIKVDLDGNLVDEPDAPMHKAGFVIHSAIHGGREDVDCVIHTHSKAGVAVAAMKEGLLPLSQHAQLFYGRIGYHDYEGLAVDIDERARLVRDLGDNPVMILRNHGLLAVGPSIPLAFSNLFNLQFACEAQVLAMAGNAALNLPTAAVSKHTAKLAVAPEAPFGTEWAGLLRRLDRIDASYRT